MSYPTYLTNIGGELGEAIDYEVGRARKKFPKPDKLLAALTEEVGELARAMLEGTNVREEAIQVAAVACRIIQEGDPTLGINPLPGDDRRRRAEAEARPVEEEPEAGR